MSGKDAGKLWRLGLIFTIVLVGCLFSGCDVSSIEQSSTNGSANSTAVKSRRLNFADANPTPDKSNSNQAVNRANSNSTSKDANNAPDENIDGAANAEIPENTETLTVVQPAQTQSNRSKQPAKNPQFDFPAAQNQISARFLAWTFGGKTQIGWYIYKPLICQTIGVEVGASENDFAEVLSGWQKANGLEASGILNAPTLALFVDKWQANRLKIHGYPAPSELLVAPTVDFYDVSRPDELRQVQRDTYVAYKKLVAAAIADKSLNLQNKDRDELAASEKFLKIVSSFRSREYQDKLRKESPNSGRAGLAVGNSPHFTGRALDVYVGGEPVTTKDENRAVQVNTKIYLWLVKNAEKFGFKPYFYEPWHWEYAPD